MRRIVSLLAVLTLFAVPACAADNRVDGSGSGSGGDGDPLSGSGGSQASGYGGGTDASGGSGGGPAVCPSASGVYAAQPSPSNVLFMFDRSGSMYLTVTGGETRWDAMKSGFFSLLENLPSEVNAGIEMFPRGDAPVTCCAITFDNDIDCSACASGELPGPSLRCDVGTYDAPPIAVDVLGPSQVNAIENLVTSSDGNFYWGTPTAPALEGAMEYMSGQAFPGISSIVLMTDGNPTSCDTASDPLANDISRVTDVVSAGFASPNPIRTFVLGIVDGDAGVLGASEANLSLIAQAGGTARFAGCEQTNDCAYAVNTGNFAADLQTALDAIALQAFSCTFDMPEVQGGAPDYNAVNITITANAQTSTIGRDIGHASGWDYLPGFEQIQLYGAACDLMKTDANAKLEVIVGCETVGP